MKSGLIRKILNATAVPAIFALAIGCQSLEKAVIDYFKTSEEESQSLESPIISQIEGRLRELPGDYKPKYPTTAHRSIKMSKDLGAMAEDYKTLDEIIEHGVREVKEHIKSKGHYNAVQVLNIIGNVVDEYSKETKEKSHPSLFMALRDKNLDCDKKSFLYKAIGETMNLPMHLMYFPEHIFIRLDWGENYHIDWETTKNDFFENYKAKFGDKINENYPKKLNEEEILAVQFFNRGGSWILQPDITGFDFIRALSDYSMATELFPEFWDAYYNKGVCLMEDNKNDLAINEFSEAINLWKTDAISHNQRGLCYMKGKRYEKAIEDFSRATELKKDFWQAYNNRAMTYLEIGEMKKALEDMMESLRLYTQK